MTSQRLQVQRGTALESIEEGHSFDLPPPGATGVQANGGAISAIGGGAAVTANPVWLGQVAEGDEEQGRVEPVPVGAAVPAAKGPSLTPGSSVNWARPCCSQCRPAVKVGGW